MGRRSTIATHPQRDAMVAAAVLRPVRTVAREYGVEEASLRRYLRRQGFITADEQERMQRAFAGMNLHMAHDLLQHWGSRSLGERLTMTQAPVLLVLQRALESGMPHIVLAATNTLAKLLDSEIRYRGTERPEESLADADRTDADLTHRIVAWLRARPELAEDLLHDLGHQSHGALLPATRPRPDAHAAPPAAGAGEASVDAGQPPEREDVHDAHGGGGPAAA